MIRAGPLIAALALCASRPAFAYRPFDGTDAAVAERAQLEIELEPVGLLREGPDRFLVVPALIANVGIAERLEIVLEGRHHFLLGAAARPPRTRFVDTGLSLKGVVRQGELQERSGPSVAIEVGALLPTLNDEAGVGAQAAVIVSRRFSRATIHLNGGVVFSRSTIRAAGEGQLAPRARAERLLRPRRGLRRPPLPGVRRAQGVPASRGVDPPDRAQSYGARKRRLLKGTVPAITWSVPARPGGRAHRSGSIPVNSRTTERGCAR